MEIVGHVPLNGPKHLDSQGRPMEILERSQLSMLSTSQLRSILEANHLRNSNELMKSSKDLSPSVGQLSGLENPHEPVHRTFDRDNSKALKKNMKDLQTQQL